MSEEILILFASSINLALTILITYKSKSKHAKYFALSTLSVSIWGFSTILLNSYTNMLWERLVFLSATSGVYFITLFSTQYIKKESLILRRLSAGMFIILLFAIAFTRTIVADVSRSTENSGILVELGPGINLFSLFVVIELYRLIYNLVHGYRTSKYTMKLQLRYLISGIILFIVPTLITNLILPIFNIFSFNNLGVIFSIFLTSLVTLSIIRHRLFGIRFVIGRTLYLILIALLPFVTFHLVYAVQIQLWGSVIAPEALFTGFLYSILFVYVLFFANTRLKKIIDRHIVNPGYVPEAERQILSKKISSELRTDTVVTAVLSTIHATVDPKSSGIIIFDLRNRKVLFRRYRELKLGRGKRDLLEVIQFWDDIDESKPIIAEEIRIDEMNYPLKTKERLGRIVQYMRKKKIAAIFPLNRKVQLNGLLLLGGKADDSAYTVQDIQFIESIVANASVAIGRSLLYRQVQDFASNLEEKVDKATEKLEKQARQLKRKNKALERASQRERDMMDIVGHELRTPATIVKNAIGYLQMLQRMDKLTESKLRTYLQKAEDSIEREIKLINTFLGAAKLEGNQMQFDPTKFSVPELIKQVVSENKFRSKEKGLKLVYKQTRKNIPPIEADRTRIAEVIDNLISNAIKYTHDGTITVWCDTNKKKNKVTVHVKDTGKGISKKDQKKLFTKFGRIKTYISEKERMAQIVRPGGTGLGLFVVKGIVDLHGGKVDVQSTPGKGSTFSFTLPVKSKVKKKNLINPIFKRDGEKNVFNKLESLKKRKDSQAKD